MRGWDLPESDDYETVAGYVLSHTGVIPPPGHRLSIGDAEIEQLIQGYRDMSDHIAELSTDLFEIFPKTDFEVRRVEPFREQSAAGGSYMAGTPDGSRPGVFYANLRDVADVRRFGMRTLAYHEAVPGHHLQIALAFENDTLPLFRRLIPFTAFVEGWALYSERLCEELGLYGSDLDRVKETLTGIAEQHPEVLAHYQGRFRQILVDEFQDTNMAQYVLVLQLTAGWRARFGHVLLFDPTNAASAAYNPLLEVRRGEREVSDVQNIADVLVDPEGQLERKNHWVKTSHSLSGVKVTQLS